MRGPRDVLGEKVEVSKVSSGTHCRDERRGSLTDADDMDDALGGQVCRGRHVDRELCRRRGVSGRVHLRLR